MNWILFRVLFYVNACLSLVLYLHRLSISLCSLPEQLKVAMVRPLLEKPSLDHREFKNFRPISNLQFLRKIIEKVVTDQLINYLDNNNLQVVYPQSAYKPSAETALIRNHNDILTTVGKHRSVILLLQGISAAFDTIHHDFLLSDLGVILVYAARYLIGFHRISLDDVSLLKLMACHQPLI